VEGVKKGFIFSVDAMGAVALVVVLAMAWVFYVHYETGMAFEQRHKTAQDRALVNLYMGIEENQDMNISKETSVCKKYFFYQVAGTISESKYCEARET